MMYGISRLNRRGCNLWSLIFVSIVACAAPPPASIPAPTPISEPVPFPTLTPFQPASDSSPDPYASLNTPQAAPTFTPYPTQIVIPQDSSAPVNPNSEAGGMATFYNPLTGLPVDDPAFLQRRPLAIKIGNSPDYVRPQSGLSLADVVYEYYIEWGDTRFVGIFYSNASIAERVGPVRSGRYFDEHLVRMYHAYLMFKGADPRELDYFHSLDIAPFFITVGFGNCPPYFMGPYKREGYNNVFFNAAKWEACTTKKGWDNSPQTLSGGFFSEETPQSPTVVARIYNYFSAVNYSFWAYEPERQNYVRYQETKDLVNRKVEVYDILYDDFTREPVTADNVVVLFVPYIFTNQNQAQDEVYNPQLIDYGDAYVFRDGLAIPARWNRAAIDQPFILTHPDGSPIYLRPGRTFYELMGVTSRKFTEGTEWRFEFVTP
ncbi:DUF3048 domain-containing protein [Chloroflexi bacterium CFX5]|nr:DUF3048 domain-containing protein [Anaerolineales bacterium]MDL1919079.1 DUF3048 domain-containing protein [Chloroflexi bacterium CFX5]NUQ59035.1 DUF3048 domain-containing protein [Anaerolineales bacterium]